MSVVPDHELALRTLRGDKLAYNILVERYQRAVFAVCYRMLANAKTAEDIAQEVFMRAYKNIASYDTSRPFGPWVRRIAVNLSINHLKKKRFNLLPYADYDERMSQREDKQPEQQVLLNEQARELQQVLQQLPLTQLTVIEMHHFHDMSYREIAEQLAMPINTVKSHLFRARKKLAEKLRERDDG